MADPPLVAPPSPTPPPLASTEVRAQALAYVADLLEACTLRGAFQLDETRGLSVVVDAMRATDETLDDGTTSPNLPNLPKPTASKARTEDAYTDAWKCLHLAQARGKLTLHEAWCAYNAMDLCGVREAGEHVREGGR